MAIDVFASGLFSMRKVGIIDHDDDIYDDEFYPEKASTQRTSATAPIILEPPQKGSIHGRGIKILFPKQMLQRLPILLAPVQASNTYENLLNKIRKSLYSFFQPKQISKKYTTTYSD